MCSKERRSCVDSKMMQTAEFAFSIHLMKNVLGINNELSLALQRKDQDVVVAMDFLKIAKQ